MLFLLDPIDLSKQKKPKNDADVTGSSISGQVTRDQMKAVPLKPQGLRLEGTKYPGNPLKHQREKQLSWPEKAKEKLHPC